MIIRKFVGKTESEAAAAAQKELGDGYVIMNVRSVKPKGAFSVFRKKQVELTAAKEDDEEPIRQIRKIAQAQVEASKKSLPPLTGAGIVAAQKEKESVFFGYKYGKMHLAQVHLINRNMVPVPPW